MAIPVEAWQHRDIITNGIRMHYVTQGDGKGPLVVLLHGFPEFWYSWRSQIPFLAEHGYTVVAPDMRGYNDSDKPSTGYDIPTLIRDIKGLISGVGQLGLERTRREKAIIVGHDWGGALAWIFALRYPEMTERLIVLNAPHPAAMMRDLRTARQLRKSWYIFFFQLPWLPDYALSRNHASEVGRMLRGAAVQKQVFSREVTAKFQEAMSKPGAMTAALNYYRQLRRMPARLRQSAAEMPRITAPTLLIWGEQDIALDISLTEGLEQWVEQIQIRLIPDSGHWVQQEKPDLVNSFMLDFLQK